MKKDIARIILLLRKELGETTPAVWHKDPFKVLISTVLSQRTRDENTVLASQLLFSKYKTAKRLANASVKDIEKLIKPSGFYKVKARRIKEISRQIVEKFGGKVPKKREELLLLPGVGWKTSGIVIVFGFGKAEAIPVDTHVHRISNRIGLVKTKIPEKTERGLMKIIPRKYRIELNELMVKFGQIKCKPIKPLCLECSLQKYCDYYERNYP